MSAPQEIRLDAPIVDAPAGGGGHTVVLPGQTPEGEYILSVLLKRSYDIVHRQRCTRVEKDRKLVPGDMHYDDPMSSSLRFESDYVPIKLATDVVLNGTVYVPGGAEAYTLMAELWLGPVRKYVHVVGDRVARYNGGAEPLFTEPLPFSAMPLRYERAYGGVDIYSDPKVPCVYARNPLGRGFAVQNVPRAVDNLPLPNLEEPTDPLTPARLCAGHFMHWERQPMPCGMGWLHKTWQPRASLAGVLPADRATEQQLRAAYAELLPADQKKTYLDNPLPDIDFRFFNGASAGLALPYLAGNEPVRTINLAPEGTVDFLLPGDAPRIALDIGFGAEEKPPVLHTVMIHMDERQVDLVWRAAFAYPGPEWLPEMTKMEVSIL
jgi:hypothetical protein